MINSSRKFNLIVFLIILISLLTSLIAVYSIDEKENDSLLPDFYRNYNTVKFVSEKGFMPKEIELNSDMKGVMDHKPLYYYLSAGLLKVTKGLNEVKVLQYFSTFLIFLTNIIFYLFLKKIIKKKKFIIYSLALFCFLPTHLFISLFVGPDPLFYFLFILSLYFFITLKQKKDIKSSLIFGFLLGLALLARVQGLILIASLFLYNLYLYLKKNKERNLFLVSLILSIIVGAYGVLRNYFLFGKLLVSASVLSTREKGINTFIRLFNSFWGGIYGGLNSIKILIIICVIILLLIFIFSLTKYFSSLNKKDHLLFLSIICFLTLILIINLTCNFTTLITNFKCIGNAAQNRYLIPFEPFISILIGFGLYKLENKKYLKYLIPIFIILCCSLFAIDFIFALI